MTLAKLEEYLETFENDVSKIEISSENFLYIHSTVEGYWKRLLFIGIRANGVQYEMAKEVMKKVNLSANATVEKAQSLLETEFPEIKNYFKSNTDLGILMELFRTFCSPYRNWCIHGVMDAGKDTLQLCIYVNILLIKELEKTLEANNLPSAFDRPRKFLTIGKITNPIDADAEAVMKRLGFDKRATQPITKEKVIEKTHELQNINIKEILLTLIKQGEK